MIIKISGRTFQHRELIRRLRGYWSNDEKCWLIDFASQGDLQELQNRVGLMVNVVDDTPVIVQQPTPNQTFANGSIYGDDPTYYNYFADQNPKAFFGFSSLPKLIEYVDSLPASQRTDPARSGWRRSDGSFEGTETMKEALDLARNGWQDCVAASLDVIDRLTVANPRIRARRASIAGGSVNVGRLLSGDPAHMIKRPKQPGQKVVTFFVECGFIANIRTETAIFRAAIIAAMIDLMENAGYSATVVAVDTSLDLFRPYYQLAVTLKEAGERLNLNDVIFALGHPSFLRRLSFATCSSVDETKRIWGHQGDASNAFNDEHRCKSNEFYVPVIVKNLLTDNLKNALKYIKPVNFPVEMKVD